MIAKAKARYVRISPKKVRLVIRRLKDKDVREAEFLLKNINKRAARFVRKVLGSAYDNAKKKNPELRQEDLLIKNISANSGPSLRRYRAMSMGRAGLIRKRMSHISVHLDLKDGGAKKPEKSSKMRSIFKKKNKAKDAAAGKKTSEKRDKKTKKAGVASHGQKSRRKE